MYVCVPLNTEDLSGEFVCFLEKKTKAVCVAM